MSNKVVYQFLFKVNKDQDTFYLTGNRYASENEVLSVYPAAVQVLPCLPSAMVIDNPKVKVWQWLYLDKTAGIYKTTEFKYPSDITAMAGLRVKGISSDTPLYKIEDSEELV